MSPYIWKNGDFVEQTAAPAQMPALCTDIRFYQTDTGPALFRVEEQVDQFLADARAAGIEVGCSAEALYSVCNRAILFNQMEEGFVRPAIYELPAGPIVTISTHQFVATPPVAATREKVISAAREYDAQCSQQTLFLVRGNVVVADALKSSSTCLVRNSMITLARDLGYDVVEAEIPPQHISAADEAFYTTPNADVTPLTKTGPVADALQNAFTETAHGRGARSAEWLDWVWNSYLGL